MPYCAVYKCFSSSNVDKNVSFFQIPKDVTLQKIWLRYCNRREFTFNKHSRLCSKHFTPEQYLRLPSRMAELGYPNARAQLKNGAIPDVPWTTPGRMRKNCAHVYNRKKPLIELSHNEEGASDGITRENNVSSTAVGGQFEPASSVDRAVQVLIPKRKVKTRTKGIQVGKNKSETVDIGVQCEPFNNGISGAEITHCANCRVKHVVGELRSKAARSRLLGML
ncbi:uncharacterized protein LOC133174359 [Saccostrea echinata]|uniref:uncharacterized protein LOC133174359 n=1 Tax=Saccostrea echinata TaxID=191078 RepID=UPI002A81C968|nr:uncharacterized protein LOC133174359 [Saccostrea echinata]